SEDRVKEILAYFLAAMAMFSIICAIYEAMNQRARQAASHWASSAVMPRSQTLRRRGRLGVTTSANRAVAGTSGAEAADAPLHYAASSRRSAWPTSGRRPPCERGHPCGDTAEILRTTHSSASTP